MVCVKMHLKPKGWRWDTNNKAGDNANKKITIVNNSLLHFKTMVLWNFNLLWNTMILWKKTMVLGTKL